MRDSSYALHERYEQLNDRAAGGEAVDPAITALAERENSNSIDVLNALLAGEDETVPQAADDDNSVVEFLKGLSEDLLSRWQGAVFALNPRNPDAARHFCASVREIFREILDEAAPDDAVIAANSDCERTPQGTPSRRSKIIYLLHQKRSDAPELSAFIEADISNILELFGVPIRARMVQRERTPSPPSERSRNVLRMASCFSLQSPFDRLRYQKKRRSCERP